MAFILGINTMHADAAAALVTNGEIVVAVEERLMRIKHWAGFPTEAIKWCLSKAGPMMYIMKTRPDLSFLIKRWKNKEERNNPHQQLCESFPGRKFNSKLHYVEHHLSYLASAFYASSFVEASIVLVDGFGDFASSAWGFGCGTKIREDVHIFFPHSLRALYTALTQYLGIPNYGSEHKVMGLAGRLQTVSEGRNERYYKLISSFHRKTDVPMVLNTSFHENEPIVCTMEEALNCFLRTKMDVLAVENWLI